MIEMAGTKSVIEMESRRGANIAVEVGMGNAATNGRT